MRSSNFLRAAWATLVASIFLREAAGALTIKWDLENYNDWDLPFAKTVEI